MDDSGEIFDVVDSQDQVIGQATRGEVHARGLLHRAVHILVFDSEGNLFLQKRAWTKDENPGFWDTSAAGHVNAGEDYRTCAHRELREELGISENLEFSTKFTAGPETLWEHVEVYYCSTDQKITPNPREITDGRFWSPDDLKKAVEERSGRFTSTFLLIFDCLLKTKGSRFKLLEKGI